MFAFLIDRYMLERNVSVEKIINVTGLPREEVEKIIRNEINDVPLSVIYKIAKVLDIGIPKLYYSIEEIDILRQRLNWRIQEYGINDFEVKELVKIINIFQNIKIKNKNNTIT